MDPLTVLSLAETLVQFVELSGKILVEAHAACNAGTGASARVESLCEQADALQALINRASTPGADGTGTEDEMALGELSGRVKRLGKEVVVL
jgi:hypothetical protein